VAFNNPQEYILDALQETIMKKCFLRISRTRRIETATARKKRADGPTVKVN
jgi:hypothetical protein